MTFSLFPKGSSPSSGKQSFLGMGIFNPPTKETASASAEKWSPVDMRIGQQLQQTYESIKRMFGNLGSTIFSSVAAPVSGVLYGVGNAIGLPSVFLYSAGGKVSQSRQWVEKHLGVGGAPASKPPEGGGTEKKPEAKTEPETKPEDKNAPEKKPEAKNAPEKKPEAKNEPEEKNEPEKKPDEKPAPARARSRRRLLRPSTWLRGGAPRSAPTNGTAA